MFCQVQNIAHETSHRKIQYSCGTEHVKLSSIAGLIV